MINTFDSNGNKLFDFEESREIARGGEGMIFSVQNKKKLAAKIYLPGITPLHEDKFIFLNKLDEKIFVKPQELLYDKKGKVIGFTMEYLKHDYFPLNSIFNKNFCLQNNITYSIKEKIGKNLINAVNFAHASKIIIGDLSGLNTLVNISGDIKFIDVDSYEVPNFKHNGKLLDDIRDYLYNGVINEKSDFFALSVVCFYFLTYLHPFRGMHSKYNTMADRMIHKLPVFANDKDLRTPKCYEPLSDKNLIQQYEQLYLRGERFMLSLDKFITSIPKKVQKTTLQQGDLMIQIIFNEETIEYANFHNEQGVIRTKNKFRLYSTPKKSSVNFKGSLDRTEWNDVFIGNENVICYKNDKFFMYHKDTVVSEEITNLHLHPANKFAHIDNLLISIDDDYIYIVYLDSVKLKNIKYDRNKVFTDGFKLRNGFIQSIGGKQYLHFKQGEYICSVGIPVEHVIGAYVRCDVGILQYVLNNEIKFQFFKIDNLKIEMLNLYAESFLHFAYAGTKHNNANIFIPADEKILVYRATDMMLITEITCDLIDTNTKLFYTTAGIIAVNENEVLLLNKK